MKLNEVLIPFHEIKISPKGEEYQVVLVEKINKNDKYWKLGTRIGIRYLKTRQRKNLIFDKFNNLIQVE